MKKLLLLFVLTISCACNDSNNNYDDPMETESDSSLENTRELLKRKWAQKNPKFSKETLENRLDIESTCEINPSGEIKDLYKIILRQYKGEEKAKIVTNASYKIDAKGGLIIEGPKEDYPQRIHLKMINENHMAIQWGKGKDEQMEMFERPRVASDIFKEWVPVTEEGDQLSLSYDNQIWRSIKKESGDHSPTGEVHFYTDGVYKLNLSSFGYWNFWRKGYPSKVELDINSPKMNPMNTAVDVITRVINKKESEPHSIVYKNVKVKFYILDYDNKNYRLVTLSSFKNEDIKDEDSSIFYKIYWKMLK
ncbi:hypothetical protein [Bacteroidetes bacterium endosymbiont of Geopemphigus sp.]|uniref:hypothetical protein n=1 Tax=Bacteroidetes bacterium endosymbiont of Geopemphigus sp. TaxID=2047937 RepID=UPI000CD0B545|nr:hypothetical protein [Bacteroidetes bacterium endosymbiont of Geopemphigus sp.]